jgi:hypothetical protein
MNKDLPLTRHADQRVRLTKQAIQGARTIKMSGWEVLLEKRIKEVR